MNAQVHLFSLKSDLGLIPEKFALNPEFAYAFETGSICSRLPQIALILASCGDPKISVGIIECVVISVVCLTFVSEFQSKNKSRHRH